MDHRLLVTAAALFALAGCESGDPCLWDDCNGSGGGPGGTGGGLITLTEQNSLAALREAWFAVMFSADLPAYVAATGVGDTSGGIATVVWPATKIAPQNVYVDPFGPTTYNCPVSGTFIVSGDVADQQTITVGDTVTWEASACDSGTGFVVDGTHSLDVTSLAGDVSSGSYEQGQRLNFTDFTATEQSLVTIINGDHSAVIDATSSTTIAMSYSGTNLVVDQEGVVIAIRSFTGNTTQDINSPFTQIVDASGNASSSAVGSFNYDTDEAISQNLGADPHDGILDIVGAGGGTSRVVVNEDGGLFVQMDLNGSGNHEISIAYTWAEFFGGAALPSNIERHGH